MINDDHRLCPLILILLDPPPFLYLQDPDLYSPLQVPLVPLQFENPAMVLLADGNYVI